MENTPSTLANANRKIADLERQLAAAVTTAQIYEQKIAKMKKTFSWKLTGPFRELVRGLARLGTGLRNFRLQSWLDPHAWKRFFREAERQFRLARRTIWKKKEKFVPNIKPASARALKIQADLQSAVTRHRKAA